MQRVTLAPTKKVWHVYEAHGPATGEVCGYWVVRGQFPGGGMDNVREVFGQARYPLLEARRLAMAAATEANFLGL